jgi:hypothetical protein
MIDCVDLGVCQSKTPPCFDCPNLKGKYMYIVVWLVKFEDGEPRDMYVTHESFVDAKTHYNSLIAMKDVYTASICSVIESTDYSPLKVSHE